MHKPMEQACRWDALRNSGCFNSQATSIHNLSKVITVLVSWPAGGAGCPDLRDHLAVLEGSSGWAQGGICQHFQSDDKQLSIFL